jgi:hypothetical protein
MIINDSSEDSFNDIETIQNPAGKVLTIGGIVQAGFSRHSDAQVDEVGFWDRVLTAAEITELYRSGGGNQHPFGGNTTITHEIKPGGGGDYTTLSAWESAKQRDLGGLHESARALCYGGDLGVVTIDGWTTASGNRVIIEAAAEAMHSGVVALDSEVAHIDGGSSSCIDIRDSYVSVSGLALEGTGAAHNIFVFGASDGGVEVDKIVTNGRSNSVHFQNSGSGNHLRNSIVHDTALGLRANGAGCHVLAQNNTIHGGTDGALNTINNGRITEDNNYLTTDLGEPIYQTGTGRS